MSAADFSDAGKSGISSRHCTGNSPENFLAKKRKFFASVGDVHRQFASVNDMIATANDGTANAVEAAHQRRISAVLTRANSAEFGRQV